MSSRDFPYTMSRCVIVMRPERSDPHEVEGVPNPAASRHPGREHQPAVRPTREAETPS
jgi:hypothetical protein